EGMYQLRQYAKPLVINIKPEIFNNFDKENYLNIETYSGLFGIECIYYHWKHKA
ncbi:hypothetical protein SAMN05421768_1041, partial [Chryseobacterium joostei]